MEQEIMEIITYGGDARSKSLLALKEISRNNFAKAEEYLKEADKAILTAHKTQTHLLTMEASGEIKSVSLLLVHAQDHLMDAMTIRDITAQMMEIQKQNYKLLNEQKMSD